MSLEIDKGPYTSDKQTSIRCTVGGLSTAPAPSSLRVIIPELGVTFKANSLTGNTSVGFCLEASHSERIQLNQSQDVTVRCQFKDGERNPSRKKSIHVYSKLSQDI